MTLEEFKKLHHKFSKKSLPKETWDSYSRWWDIYYKDKLLPLVRDLS